MKTALISSLFSILFMLASCCHGDEVGQYFLSEQEKAFIPYQEGNSFRFKHSNGYEFDLEVYSSATDMRMTESDHCGENYYSYEIKEVKITSLTPFLEIDLSITPEDLEPILEIRVNTHAFHFPTPLVPDFSSISIEGVEYQDVCESLRTYVDSSMIEPSRILYSSSMGIIKIEMSNREYYVLSS